MAISFLISRAISYTKYSAMDLFVATREGRRAILRNRQVFPEVVKEDAPMDKITPINTGSITCEAGGKESIK
ncbi:hypothetical protein KTH_21800 [Thermosporothrix hazakensis]|nr:hypothetical protein KTH_21800 [Thermosporothrix hazakensis]